MSKQSESSAHSEHSRHSALSEKGENSEYSECDEQVSNLEKTSCAHDPDGSEAVDPGSAVTLPRPHVPGMRANVGVNSANGRDSVSRFPELSGEYLAPSPCQLESGLGQVVAGVVGGRPVRHLRCKL